MNKILVPTDFSEHSENALFMAANLAKTFNGSITVVHMLGYKEGTLNRVQEQNMQELIFQMKLAEKNLESFLDKPYLTDIDVEVVIKKTKLFKELPEVAESVNASLIVMGSHGASGFEELTVGSNTQKVVRYSKTPVMVIKDNMDGFKIDSAVFACDFDTQFIEPFIKACDFFKSIDVELHIVYVNTPGNFKTTGFIENKMKTFLDLANSKKECVYIDPIIYCDKSIESGIFNYCNEVNAGLIGLSTHGGRQLSGYFAPHVSEHVANHSSLPVITFNL